MLKYLLLTSLLLISNVGYSVQTLGTEFLKMTGDAYIDTSDLNTNAIGRISSIIEGDVTRYTYGSDSQYLYFVVEDVSPSVITEGQGYSTFSASGGTVLFYSSNVDLFNTVIDYSSFRGLMVEYADLFMTTYVDGSINGIFTPISYAANGFLSLSNIASDGSSDPNSITNSDRYDTNTRLNFMNSYSDLSFSLVGAVNNNSPLVNSNYEYIVSADLQGAVPASPVPLPGAFLFMVSGLLGIRFFKI